MLDGVSHTLSNEKRSKLDKRVPKGKGGVHLEGSFWTFLQKTAIFGLFWPFFGFFGIFRVFSKNVCKLLFIFIIFIIKYNKNAKIIV